MNKVKKRDLVNSVKYLSYVSGVVLAILAGIEMASVDDSGGKSYVEMCLWAGLCLLFLWRKIDFWVNRSKTISFVFLSLTAAIMCSTYNTQCLAKWFFQKIDDQSIHTEAFKRYYDEVEPISSRVEEIDALLQQRDDSGRKTISSEDKQVLVVEFDRLRYQWSEILKAHKTDIRREARERIWLNTVFSVISSITGVTYKRSVVLFCWFVSFLFEAAMLGLISWSQKLSNDTDTARGLVA